MFGHEVNDFRRDLLACDCQIAFVFTVFVIDDDQHAARSKVFNGFGNRSEWHGLNNQDSNGEKPNSASYTECIPVDVQKTMESIVRQQAKAEGEMAAMRQRQ